MKGFKGSCQRGRAGVVNSARLFYAEGTMTDIAIFWDASQLWGLLVWRAAEAFGLPYRLVKAKEIAQGALSDKTSLLIVPGGTARHKSAALGEKGREAVRAWVRGGGRYVGFCGGAGLGLSDAAFGLWAGTAVNDTSSVVATGYAFSEAAGDFATMVKLTRTLAIIPAVLVFAAINLHLKKKESAQANGVKVRIRSIFPWFILAFLAMSLLTSLGLLPAGLVSGLKTISKFLMVAALAAIGLNTNFKSLCRSGAKPMLHGFIISTLVVLVAIGVEYMIGIAPYGTL